MNDLFYLGFCLGDTISTLPENKAKTATTKTLKPKYTKSLLAFSSIVDKLLHVSTQINSSAYKTRQLCILFKKNPLFKNHILPQTAFFFHTKQSQNLTVFLQPR